MIIYLLYLCMWQIYAVSITIRIVVSIWWLFLGSNFSHLYILFVNPFIQLLLDIMTLKCFHLLCCLSTAWFHVAGSHMEI